jgi:hypothetical protein
VANPSTEPSTGDREPQPSDGPDYHADHAAWERRQDDAGDGCAECGRYTWNCECWRLDPVSPDV